MSQWSQVSRIALCMAKVKVTEWVTEWLSEWQGHLLSCCGQLMKTTSHRWLAKISDFQKRKGRLPLSRQKTCSPFWPQQCLHHSFDSKFERNLWNFPPSPSQCHGPSSSPSPCHQPSPTDISSRKTSTSTLSGLRQLFPETSQRGNRRNWKRNLILYRYQQMGNFVPFCVI